MKTYTGGCHCQKVRYEVDIENFDNAITCNCSICSKKGLVLTFVPESSFRLQSGQDNLTKYNFNKNVIDHLFCKTCGVESFGKGKDGEDNVMVAINILCLDGFDLKTINPTPINGKDV